MDLLYRYAAALLELAASLDDLELAEGLFALADYLGVVGDDERRRWREDYATRLRSLLPTEDRFRGGGADEADVFDEGRSSLARLEAGHGALFTFIRTRLFRPRPRPAHAAVARRELLVLASPLVNVPGACDQSQLIGRALLVVYMLQLRFAGVGEMGGDELSAFQRVFNRDDEFTLPISSAADRLWVRSMQNAMFRESLDGLVASAAGAAAAQGGDTRGGINLEEVAATLLRHASVRPASSGVLVETAHLLAALGYLFGHGDSESYRAWRRAVEESAALPVPGPPFFTVSQLKTHLPKYLGRLRVEPLLTDLWGRLVAFADPAVRKALLKRGTSLKSASDHIEHLLGAGMQFIAVLALRGPGAREGDDEERRLFEDAFGPPSYVYAFEDTCPTAAFLAAADAVLAAFGPTRFADSAEEEAAAVESEAVQTTAA